MLLLGSRGTTKCQQERSEAQKIARRPTAGIFIPECKKDGAYMEVQCHAATSFCWCVTKEGRPISGTSLQGKKPSCKGTELNIWRLYVWLKDFRYINTF